VESANKTKVLMSHKTSGYAMGGTPYEPLLALRNLVCNERWREDPPSALGGLPDIIKPEDCATATHVASPSRDTSLQ